MSAARLDDLERRVAELESHRLPERVTNVEGAVLSINRQLELNSRQLEQTLRQLELLFAQGKSHSNAIGAQGVTMERVAGLLEQFVRQQTPSVVTK